MMNEQLIFDLPAVFGILKMMNGSACDSGVHRNKKFQKSVSAKNSSYSL